MRGYYRGGCPVPLYRGGHAAAVRRGYVYNTTRVDIHMACICEEKGVGYHIELLRSSTIGAYIQIYIKIYKSPHAGALFPFYPFL